MRKKLESDRYNPDDIEHFLDNLLTKEGIVGLSQDESCSVLEKFLLSNKKTYGLFKDEIIKTRIVFDYLRNPDEFFPKAGAIINNKKAKRILSSKQIEKAINEYQSLFYEFEPSLKDIASHQNMREFLVLDEIFYTIKDFLIGRPLIDLSLMKSTILGACKFISERQWVDPDKKMYYLDSFDFSEANMKDFYRVFGEHLEYITYKDDISSLKNIFSLINEEIYSFPKKINLNYAIWLTDFFLDGDLRECLREEIMTKSKLEIYSRNYEFVKNLIEKINSISLTDSLGLVSFFGSNYETVSSVLNPIQNKELKEAYSNARELALKRMKEYNDLEINKIDSALSQVNSIKELEQIANSVLLTLNENYKFFGRENSLELKNIAIERLEQKKARLNLDDLKIKELEELKGKIGYNLRSIYDSDLNLSQNIAREKGIVGILPKLNEFLSYAKKSDNERLKSEIRDYVNAVFDLVDKCTGAIFDEENKLLNEIEKLKRKKSYEGIKHSNFEILRGNKSNLKLLKTIKKEHEKDAMYISDSIKKALGQSTYQD